MDATPPALRAPTMAHEKRPTAAAPKPVEKSDEELMLAYQKGDASAFRALVVRHEKPIYRFCLRSLGDKEAAADATQEVFLRVVKNVMRWEQKAKFTTFLYTIARNFCIDEARKRVFRKTDSLNEKASRDEGSGLEKQDLVKDENPLADRVHDGKKIRAVVEQTLAALPEEQREVFCMRQYSGLSFKEIADATGAGENTVKSRMRYALESLKKALLAAGFDGQEPARARAGPADTS